ncbi:ATP-binding protein [Saccharopolyspora mangrovi]|uniref:AAA family ATPase n=1 Tax=Saccharopolyspora mangrovi TaxID=3082379 RepID=A0ABU6AIQ2_9PSEU|nr:AAA family ATPase [Saccharopolyspora sp. S2-29]MEB3371438.1 AAA family ATPase [Saccharopolyspora sp. S2-29]
MTTAEPVVFGRDAELDELRRLVGSVIDGTGAALWIEGEPGIGKTALLSRILAEAALKGCAVRHATADRFSRQFPLRLVLDCLGVGPQSAEPELRALHERLSGAADGPAAPVADELAELVVTWCADAPLVVVVDDIQWADDASVQVWQRFARLTEELPLLLIGAARPARTHTGTRAGARRLVLPPLDETAVASAAAKLSGSVKVGPKLRRVLAGASGNPRYVGEIVNGLTREGGLAVADGRSELVKGDAGMPRSLAEAVVGRLAFFDSQTTGLLRMAALLGSTFSLTELSTVSERPVSALVGYIEEALTAGVLVESGLQLSFQHALVRQALHETTPTALRLALHEQAARVLEDSGAPVERIGEQLLASITIGDDEVDDWGLDWLARNGRALAHRVPACAAEVLEAALVPMPAKAEQRDVLLAARVLALVQLDRPERAHELSERALEEVDDPACAAELSWYRVWSLAVRRKGDEAAALVAEAEATPGFGLRWLARMRATLAQAQLMAGNFTESDETVGRALAEARESGDDYALGLALHVRGTARARNSDLAEALVSYQQAGAALGDSLENADLRLQVLSNRMMLLFALGHAAEAETVLHEMLAIAESSATPSRLAVVRLSAANHYFTVGRWDDAAAELQAAGELTGEMTPHQLRWLHGLSAMLAGYRGQREAFEQQLAVAGEATPDSQENSGFLMVAGVLGAEIDGDLQRAKAILTEALDASERIGSNYVWLPMLVRFALQTGDEETAARATNACVQGATVGAAPNILAAAQHCRGLLDGDPITLRAAIEHYDKTNQPPKRARALEDLAAVLAERGEIPAARKAYVQAVEIFNNLGANWDLQRAAARMLPHGIRTPRAKRLRATTGWEALTKTERQVALLVGDGKSNPEIAAELFASRRTIEVHVSHVLAKLGVRSRVEVAVEATGHRA